MRQLSELIKAYDIDVLDYLDRSVAIEVISGAQMQGDVGIRPTKTRAATTPIPKGGIAVVRGESGGNTHTLLGEGCFFNQSLATPTSLILGTLTVPPGKVAYLAHPEHAYTGIAPGTYDINRQREWSGEWQLVAD